jgi:hypothetical protein
MSGKLPSGWFEKIAKEEGVQDPAAPSPEPAQPVQPSNEIPVHRSSWGFVGKSLAISVVHNVPFTQVHPGSAGGHEGSNHILFQAPFATGRLNRSKGQLLCGRKVWGLRKPDKDDTKRCPKCVEMAGRYSIPWPEEA